MRVAVLSDIHSNLIALDAVLAAVGPVDAVWHLGDVVGYGPDPDERRRPADRARGDRCPRQPRRGGGRRDSRSSGSTPTPGGPSSGPATGIAPATRRWLAALPERRAEEGFILVHGSPRDPTWEYVTRRAGRARQPGRCWSSRASAAVSSATPTCPSVFRDDDGRIETPRPGAGSGLALDDRPRARSTRAASASRATASRPPAASLLDTERLEAALATGRRTTSAWSSRPCGRPVCPSASSPASPSGCDRVTGARTGPSPSDRGVAVHHGPWPTGRC